MIYGCGAGLGRRIGQLNDLGSAANDLRGGLRVYAYAIKLPLLRRSYAVVTTPRQSLRRRECPKSTGSDSPTSGALLPGGDRARRLTDLGNAANLSH